MLHLKLALPLLALPRPVKRAAALALDVCLIVLTVWIAFYLRLDEWVRLSGEGLYQPMWAVLASGLIALPLFITHGFYRVIFRYSGMTAMKMVLRAFALYALLYATVVGAIGLPGVPRSVGFIQPMLLLLAVAASRALARYWLGGLYQNIFRRMNLPSAVIYGAGRAGRQLAQALSHSHEMQVLAFLDDDERLHGHVLNGLPIHSPRDLHGLIETRGVRTVLLSIPSLPRQRRNAILADLCPLRVAVRTLPNLSDLSQGRVSTADLHELDVDDLLGREPVAPIHTLLDKNIVGKVVLVTGAGGSIGSELCRQILALAPAKLLLIEQSEFALYSIHQELELRLAGRTVLLPLLASVQDDERLREIMSTWHPDTVYHAAAYKHVPLVEHNPAAGIKNNVLGTLRTAQAAAEHGVANFMLVSTDKAVRPTNMMGASKRLAEMALQALADTGTGTKFSMVRFGNVLDSSGSVVPKFRQQIRDGGPVTLTHPEVTRYFMSISEAAQLVIQAGAMAKGGDVFVLDMGQPVKIMDLARRMVELSGLTVKDEHHPEGDIGLEVTGLRPGEKLFEELLIGVDPKPTDHPRIMKAHEEFMPWAEFKEHLKVLELALNMNDVGAIRLMMRRMVGSYTPSDDIVDWVYLEQNAQAAALA
ncbi:nucleoside-diphosphate sugar epimerase/dehydratase [Hydrogenophaga sp.]|uniref:polysaccharide biosynthesis protein n=1 Tax=Hydrogenophaga sp. TaxID=1904254 RepID=UPI0019AE56C5|nr:nucleoside-diphosphate sugar epimerase/dehydratase [Hydrogenophaga sp.]MBD3894099.1 polysaccharide biosynthesis protein [Hydrogenophaga sp.]